MVPNRAGDGPPTPANADGDTAQTIKGVNELCPVFSDSGIHFPDLGLFRSGITPLPEPGLREDLVVDIFPPNDPTNSDLWDMLLASAPCITSGTLSGHTPSNLQALPVGPPLPPEQIRGETKSIFGVDNAGYEQAQANLASYDPDKKLLDFRFPSRHAVIRYVKAYYEYMDPQLPIVHGPTLDAATVPSPLLMEMMACGAMCMVGSIVLGAALNSTSGKRYFTLTSSDTKFAQPAVMTMWQREENESGWQEHTDPAEFHDTLKMIIAGQAPAQKIGDFGFLSLVSAVLDHICSFETLASSQHPNLYKSFVKEMVKPVEVLDRMWRNRAAREAVHRPMNTPLIQSAKSLLDSAYYHLYGHHQLTAMKSLLCAPETLNNPEVVQQAFKEPTDSATLGKALTRAAEALREDCRQGLRYLQGIGPYRFPPLTTASVFEGGLLLCWHLQTRRSVIPAPGSQTTLDLLIREAAAEVEAVQMKAVDDLTTFPLEANVEVLRDISVWAWWGLMALQIVQFY
ncbi:hypothetical protein SLS63_008046 [Diaporthe eres]|uniref:Transcription factor domain-containing protein n=1 Tax=Diaporthe eres TaxID=83184 RepID=A0ABR1P3V8_DIAER